MTDRIKPCPCPKCGAPTCTFYFPGGTCLACWKQERKDQAQAQAQAQEREKGGKARKAGPPPYHHNATTP